MYNRSMSEKEKIKEQIGWLKVVFGILSATLVSLSGWLATHYDSPKRITVYIALGLTVFVAVLIVGVNKKAYKKIDELGDL